MVARDQRGRHLAVMAVVIDETVCLIKVAVASDHDARWALHDGLVRILIDRGVRYLVVEGGGPFGALGLEYPEQYYQHLLGYQLRHMVPVTPRLAKRGRRLLARLVIAAMTVAVLTPLRSAPRGGVSMAIGFSPLAAIGSPRWRPCFLPTGGHVSPQLGWVRDRRRGAERVALGEPARVARSGG